MIPRIIPVLLLKDSKLVKTKKFRDPTYIGDPLNAMKVFSDKFVDEIIVVDITKRKSGKIDYSILQAMAAECFSPLTYGGGINSIDQATKLFRLGVEKISVNSAIRKSPDLVKALISRFGSQSIVGSVDIIKVFGRYRVYFHDRILKYNFLANNVIDYMRLIESQGFGELFVNFVDRDGMFTGYDTQMIKTLTESVRCPITVCGGCSAYSDIWNLANDCNISGIAAGSVFVFRNKRRGVLINYPLVDQIEKNIGL